MLVLLGLASCSSPVSTSQIEAATLHLDAQSCSGGITNQATAVVVANNLVVTVAHPFHQTTSFQLQDAAGQVEPATLIYLDPERDLAVLRLDSSPGSASPQPSLHFAEPDNETAVRFVTYADRNPDIGPRIIDATILRYTRLTLDGVGDRAGIELLAPIEPGDSGGPVLNEKGEILGLVFATAKGSDTGWAIASEEVTAAIDASEEKGHEQILLTCAE